MDQVTNELVKIVFLLAAVILGRYAIPLVKSKLRISDLKLVFEWALTFVKSAEAIYSGEGKGKDKLAQVTVWMNSKLKELGIYMGDDDVRAMIEQAVNIMHQESEKVK